MAAPIMEFSPNNEFFAFCGPDGTLRIWDTATNVLKQEFASATHLSASCTCLKWRPERNFGQGTSTSKRKRLKTGASTSAQSSIDLIALGTSSGSILLYSVLRGDLQAQYSNGHALQVNDVAWCESTNVLYSCASDSHILEWNVKNGCKKQKLKTDGPVYSICLCNGDTMMLSASRSIKLWDLAEMIVLQTFTGHATEVFRLVDVPVKRPNDKNFYFLSAARDDRYVQIWQFKSSLKKKSQQNALATMLLPDDARSLNVAGSLQEDGSYIFSVTTVAGFSLLYQQVLNGESRKPLQPKVKLQFASANLDVPRQLPVLSASIVENEKLLVSYGNPMKPTFERISYGGLTPDNCLLREVDLSLVDQVGGVSKTKTPVTSDDVKILTAGHLVPSKPTQTVSTSGKRKRHTSVDMTVEERLDVMGLAETTDKPNLQTTSSSVLLTQGLQSLDSQILNHVFQNSNPVFIRNTIRKLPIPSVIPLADELSKRMQGHAQAAMSIIDWARAFLTIHLTYLMAFPHLVEKFSTLYEMLDARVSKSSLINKAQGKLELLLSLSQASDQSADDSSEPIDALVTYQDESSDEDMLIPEDAEETPENWEDEDDESEIEDDDVEKIEESDEEE